MDSRATVTEQRNEATKPDHGLAVRPMAQMPFTRSKYARSARNAKYPGMPAQPRPSGLLCIRTVLPGGCSRKVMF